MTAKGLLRQRSRTATLCTCLAGLIAILVAWLAVGRTGPLSALLGLLMVLAFFGAGTLPFVAAGDGSVAGRAGLAFLVLGTTYLLRIVAGVAVYALASESGALNSRVIGLTVIGCTLVWTNTQLVLGLSKRHQPTLGL